MTGKEERAERGADDFLDYEDVDDDLFQFHGRIADLDKAQRYNELCMVARWMDAHSNDVEKVSFFDASPSEENGIVTLAFRRFSALRGDERKSSLV